MNRYIAILLYLKVISDETLENIWCSCEQYLEPNTNHSKIGLLARVIDEFGENCNDSMLEFILTHYDSKNTED